MPYTNKVDWGTGAGRIRLALSLATLPTFEETICHLKKRLSGGDKQAFETS